MNLISRAMQFLKDAYYELTKVTWFGKKEVLGTTIIVIIFVVIMSIFISLVDLFLNTVMRLVLY
ncbi:MAG: preprotein translocase subunit SecE [Endomicrobium sp.]|jgi:preprotein translocase subunit SecE|nr:preprotein translocase subunit SecE [Endomicrobium sp.]